MQVKKRDGSIEGIDKSKIRRSVERAAKGLTDVDIELITTEAHQQIFDGITTKEIDKATVLAARARIAIEPNYSYLAASLLLNSLYREAFAFRVDGRSLVKDYRESFKKNVLELIKEERLNPELATKFDLELLSQAIQPDRDSLFKYLGVQTLYDRYLQEVGGRRLETPQAFWMRVAMGLSLNESNPTQSAIDCYELFSTLRSCPATPTLLNSGTSRSQLSSCYLSTMEDSIDGIYGAVHQQARLSKMAGGLGIDITPLRGTLSSIRKRGKSGGYIPWAKQFNTMVGAVNQEGARKGAGCLYSEVWHVDFPDFLDLRKNTGDERRRCHDVNTASWIADAFMKRVRNKQDWYLFCPGECPDLHEIFGDNFEKRYCEYVELAKKGKIKNFKVVKAVDLWKKMLTTIKETGHPWVTFKDPSNICYTNQHAGVVHSSNLCTEIIEHTKPTRYNEEGDVQEIGECAVCNLHSINIAAHADDNGKIDCEKLKNTIIKVVRCLDNVIDLNHYPIKEAKNSNFKYRPVGQGFMGWHDLLHKKKLAFDSQEAIELADELQEFISYYTILANTELAKEKGKYPEYEGSSWSKGILPIDSYVKLVEYRGGKTKSLGKMDWTPVREAVAKYGMRNGLTMAIAPTATISFIVGCSQSIEPNHSVLYVYSTLSGEFTMVNEFFVNEMKKMKVWNEELVKNLMAKDGDVSKLVLPTKIKERFKTAFDADQRKLIDAASARQKWIDQGISLNLYFDSPSMKALSDLYFYAYDECLKTTYYLRTKAASGVEKVGSKEVKLDSTKCKIGGLMEECESCS